ncbi:MAG: hypothetical protein OXG66_19575 [Acidimicrobiaceae bacterium]|nr:hypothetical protein [Acidimicrobiaceae bacterium]
MTNPGDDDYLNVRRVVTEDPDAGGCVWMLLRPCGGYLAERAVRFYQGNEMPALAAGVEAVPANSVLDGLLRLRTDGRYRGWAGWDRWTVMPRHLLRDSATGRYYSYEVAEPPGDEWILTQGCTP